MDKDIQCVMGRLVVDSAERGYPQDPDKWFGELTDPHSKGRMVNAEARRWGRLAQFADPNEAVSFLEQSGLPAIELYSWTVAPEAILGKDVVSQIEALYTDHIAQFGHVGNLKEWNKNADAINEIMDFAVDEVRPEFKNYVEKYREMHLKGGQLFPELEDKTPLKKVIDTVTGNVVTMNPGIALYNVFEFAPKAMAVVSQNYGPKALPIIMKAINKHMQMTGGKFWQKVPEYEALGVYGVKHKPATSKFGQFLEKADIVQFTENPLRSISYTLGEELRNAGYDSSGAFMLEKVAFVNRFGNEPLIFQNNSSKGLLTLMRYSVNASKFYLGMFNEARKGNPNAIAAALLFTGMTAAQTGAESAVPLPVDMLLDKATEGEWSEALKEFDQNMPTNVFGKMLNTDFSESVQPLGGVALGAGGAIVTGATKGIGSGLGKSAAAFAEGDVAGGSLRALQALSSAMLFLKTPQGDAIPASIGKLVRATAEAVDGDEEFSSSMRDVYNFNALEE